MLQNAYLLAKIGADTAENEPKFVKKLLKIGNYPTGPDRLLGIAGVQAFLLPPSSPQVPKLPFPVTATSV